MKAYLIFPSLSDTKSRRGFTLIEMLIVIGIIAILAAIVIVAVNPAKHFAEAHNAQRRSDIVAISDAVYQYSAEKKGAPLPGIDTKLRMIGTANAGCDISCGKKISMIWHEPEYSHSIAAAIKQFFNGSSMAQAASIAPTPESVSQKPAAPYIISAKVEPAKVVAGDTMLVTAEIKDDIGVSSVTAEMDGIETIELKLQQGDKFQGTWEAKWQVHDTKPIHYLTTITAMNSQGLSVQKEIQWSDPPSSGWVLPTGYEDSGNQWNQETNAYDGNTSTYAQNTYGGAGWGQFIVLTLTSPIISNRLRINADYLDAHIQEVDVDVLKDGAWVDVFQGGSESTWNCQWVELTFPKGSVTKARFRYNYKVGGYWYWLYEFQFYQVPATNQPPVCDAQDATAIQADSAILHGVVADDGGEPVEYHFQYGKTTAYGTDTAWKGTLTTGYYFNEFISGLDNNTDYHFRGQIRNSAGTASCADKEFTTNPVETGWVLPSGYNDPDNHWEWEANAYDDNVATYSRSYHNINDPQWSSFIYLNHAAISSNMIRFYARGGNEVSAADVDVFKDGAWEDVYDGTFADKQWVEKSFVAGTVSQARIRFYAASASSGFYWELNEFGFQQSSETSETACLDLGAYLTPNYLSAIPFDPTKGSAEKTYYAIKEQPNGRITVYACNAELDATISITR